MYSSKTWYFVSFLFDKNLVCGARLFAAWEQEPNIANAVKLTREISPLGIPSIELNWKKTEFDRKTIKQSVNLFNQWLLDKELGRLQLFNWMIKMRIIQIMTN